MEGLPYDEPQTSVVARQLLREAVVDCMDRLSERDRLILDARHAEQITIRALAVRLGLHKSHTHRLCQRAEVHLAAVCIENPVIQARLNLGR